MKRDHEEAIEKTVTQAKQKEQSEVPALPLISEVVYSTLLPVTRMPRYIFSAPCKYGDSQERAAIKEVLLGETAYLCPFIIRKRRGALCLQRPSPCGGRPFPETSLTTGKFGS